MFKILLTILLKLLDETCSFINMSTERPTMPTIVTQFSQPNDSNNITSASPEIVTSEDPYTTLHPSQITTDSTGLDIDNRSLLLSF